MNIEALLYILKNPYEERGYRLLIKEYETLNRLNEAMALKELIKNDNNSNINEKQ